MEQKPGDTGNLLPRRAAPQNDLPASITVKIDSESENRSTSPPDLESKVDITPRYGKRIAPLIVGSDSSDGLNVEKQVELEADNQIKYRSCSWQKTAALLFSEYITLSIMSFPHSYAVLGFFPGILLTVLVAGTVLYTSLILWQFCLRHPDVRDICDIGQMLFWNSKIAWYLTAAMFLLNNTFIMGLHCLVGAQYLNTMTNHGACTIALAAVTAVISFFCSLPRTFSTLSKLATVSTFFTFVSVILATIFAAIESHPANYHPDPSHVGAGGTVIGGPPIASAFPAKSTTYIAGMGAFLNIAYTFIGQITIPSFIAEMRKPEDFYKSLLAVTVAEVILFSIVGVVIYAYTGTQYITSPAFGSLGNVLYKKISFSFMIPTLIFVGVLYASVSARFIFFRLFEGSDHKAKHTFLGWLSWILILLGCWIIAFIIAEIIPFFSDLLSIMSALFDSFFGFIFWGLAYIRMRRADHGPHFYQIRGLRGWFGFIVNIVLILVGLYLLGPGTYVSVQSIINNYAAGGFGTAFSCADNGL